VNLPLDLLYDECHRGMRVEYKIFDRANQMRRRMQLTPKSSLSELSFAEGFVITPFDKGKR
jgi:hypothetical protein